MQNSLTLFNMSTARIPFNLPGQVGHETQYVSEVLHGHGMCGDGIFTKKVQDWFQANFGRKVLPTTSCSSALDMAAILSEIGPGDAFIVPSYTFVSSANAFVLRGAKPLFADSTEDSPHVGLKEVQAVWTEQVKVVVVVHYAGVSYDLEGIQKFCREKKALLVEDAAQSIGAFLTPEGKQPLGTVGDLATFSFHETKNVSCGEGGCLVVNNEEFWERACIIWEKGTNRQAFYRGDVNKYGWMDVGSSFLPNEYTMAYLLAQLESLTAITDRRVAIWRTYYNKLSERLPQRSLPPDWRTSTNGHLFYLRANSLDHRSDFITKSKARGVMVHFHYQALHASPFAQRMKWTASAPNAERFSDELVRLPMHLGLTEGDVERVIAVVSDAWG